MVKFTEQLCGGPLFVYIITDLVNDWETLNHGFSEEYIGCKFLGMYEVHILRANVF